MPASGYWGRRRGAMVAPGGEAVRPFSCKAPAHIDLLRWGFGNILMYLMGALEVVRELHLCPVLTDNSGLRLLSGFDLRNQATSAARHDATALNGTVRSTAVLAYTMNLKKMEQLVRDSHHNVTFVIDPSIEWWGHNCDALSGSHTRESAFAWYLRPKPQLLHQAEQALSSCCAVVYLRTCNPTYMSWHDSCVVKDTSRINHQKNRVVHNLLATLHEMQRAVNCSEQRIFLATDSMRLKVEARAVMKTLSTFNRSISHTQRSASSQVNIEDVLLDWLAIAIAVDDQHALPLATTESSFMRTATYAYSARVRAGGATVHLLTPPNTTIVADDHRMCAA